ncbi:uncharacterized protein LOC129580729 [Paramacrobiotus metropolitanus]|uniref:uncharacterized protein LOC129580729 n=1 Tax=Paramacrobiotus metropolitanus TaxID=2943436 RepID=UPI002446295C|nr:uncharacterized protein LOC129580729 [Paramacrobiotus metropolitanus]
MDWSLCVLIILTACFLYSPVLCRRFHNVMEDGEFRAKIMAVNPEAKLNTSQIIAFHGYPVEEYRIQSEDGYLIYIQRIPCGRNMSKTGCSGRPVVVLQHGLEACSANFVTNLVQESLAYIMVDAGYDVWLGNMRGNFYGRGHIKYPVDSAEFWDFSFDEMAKYDVPAIINKALEVSEQKQLIYVGHSEGNLVGFAKFSTDTEFSEKVKLFVALAPVAYLGHLKSLPFRALAPYARQIDLLLNIFGDRDLLPGGSWLNHLGEAFCAIEPIPAELCANIIFLFGGFDHDQFNNSRADIYIAHNPSGTSTQNVFHFAQLVDSDRCQMFDYGSKKENIKHYGQPIPPEYPLAAITVPTVLMYGQNDILATPPDVARLQGTLTSLVESYKVPFDKWSHLDFIWGIEANKYVYQEILRVVKKYSGRSMETGYSLAVQNGERSRCFFFLFGIIVATVITLEEVDSVLFPKNHNARDETSNLKTFAKGLKYIPDPEASMNVTEIIRYYGYPAEEYRIQTEDDYLIYIQRIPFGRNETSKKEPSERPVIVLQHGLLSSSAHWITNLPHQSLAFILADAGYDVWLGNMRGNFYGLGHRTYPITSKEFWDFSFDEMAQYDLPAIINEAIRVSGQDKVVYIGHSQGTLIGFAKFSSDHSLARKVKLFIAMGPVGFLGHIKSPPLLLLAPFSRELAFMFRLFGYRDFLPDYPIIKYLGKTFCEAQPVPTEICENVLFLLCGYDFAQTNSSRLDVYLAHTPAGTSTQNVLHFAQLVHSDKCQMFDFGSEKENLKNYGTPVPPEYPLHNLTVPVALMYADNDWLATPVDVMRLESTITSVVDTYRVPYAKWNHLDFLWGIDANKYVYPEVFRLLRTHT